MTQDEFNRVRPVMEMAMRLHGGLNRQLRERGVLPIDALIGAVHATHHAASELHGNPIAAIEWIRDALDQIERVVLAGPKKDVN